MNKLISHLRSLCDCYDDMHDIIMYFQSGNGSGLLLAGSNIPQSVIKVLDKMQSQIKALKAQITCLKNVIRDYEEDSAALPENMSITETIKMKDKQITRLEAQILSLGETIKEMRGDGFSRGSGVELD